MLTDFRSEFEDYAFDIIKILNKTGESSLSEEQRVFLDRHMSNIYSFISKKINVDHLHKQSDYNANKLFTNGTNKIVDRLTQEIVELWDKMYTNEITFRNSL